MNEEGKRACAAHRLRAQVVRPDRILQIQVGRLECADAGAAARAGTAAGRAARSARASRAPPPRRPLRACRLPCGLGTLGVVRRPIAVGGAQSLHPCCDPRSYIEPCFGTTGAASATRLRPKVWARRRARVRAAADALPRGPGQVARVAVLIARRRAGAPAHPTPLRRPASMAVSARAGAPHARAHGRDAARAGREAASTAITSPSWAYPYRAQAVASVGQAARGTKRRTRRRTRLFDEVSMRPNTSQSAKTT